MRVKCLKCGDTLKSKHRRDFRMCSCGSVGVDGGTEMPRIIGDRENWEILKEDD